MGQPISAAATSTKEVEDAVLAIATGLAKEIQPTHRDRAFRLHDTLEGNFGFDSLSRVELLRRIESELGLTMDETAIFRVETLADLARALVPTPEKKLAQAARRTVHLLPSTEEEVSEPREVTTLVECLAWHAERHGSRPHAYILPDEKTEILLTYSALYKEALRAAAAIQDMGIEPGDRVALMLPTGSAYLTAFYGVLLAGAVPVPLYPPTRLGQVEDHLQRQGRILENSGAKVLIGSSELKARGRGMGFLLKSLAPELRKVCSVEDLSLAAALPSPVKRSAQDLALIQYTSGSTGNPKGVALTHANLLANIRAMGQAIGGSAKDTFVSWLPLYHDMGLIGAWLGSLYFGAPAVLLSPFSFLSSPARWIWAIHQYRGTLTTAPNFAYELCLKRIQASELEGLDLHSLRSCYNGAEPVSPATLKAFAERFAPFGLRPEAIAPVYGLAESSVGLTFPPQARAPLIDLIDRNIYQRTGQAIAVEPGRPALAVVACGQPLPRHEVRIVDARDHELPERLEGRIQFRGPSATGGYFRNPVENKTLFAGNWLNTGDLGYVARGDLYVTGRSKDVVIHAGRKIQPHALEEAIGGIPGIRKGCVVAFGTPNPVTGTERLVIVAETREESPSRQAELRKAINETVADHAGTAPEEALLVPAHTILKTSSGKLRRSACREMYESGQLHATPSPAWQQIARLIYRAARFRAARVTLRFIDRMYSVYAWALAVLLLAPSGALILLSPSEARARRIAQKAARSLAKLGGVSLITKGTENLPEEPCILVVNHASYLDAFALTAALPPQFGYTAKSELGQNWLLRPVLSRLGTEYIERKQKEQSISDAKKIAAGIQKGRSYIFFPEGTFTRKPGLLPFHMGAFLTAAQAGVPLVPVAISGTREVLGAESWWLHKDGRISITIAQPISPEVAGPEEASRWEIALRLRDQARREILRLSGTPDLSLEPSPVF